MDLNITRFLMAILVLLVFSCKEKETQVDRDIIMTDPRGREIGNKLLEIFEEDNPGGTVIVTEKGKTIFRGSYGLANVELDVHLKSDMVFKIGSMTKQFTAMAIAILIERGRLSFDTKIYDLLPELPETYDEITVEHLLTHTSGIRNYNSLTEWKDVIRDNISTDELVRIFTKYPLEFAPGSQWKYCNSGYTLLGKIIEKCSGQSYRDFIRTNLLDPAGMKRTFIAADNNLISRMSDGYQIVNDELRKAEFMSMSHTYAGGDILTNIEDLSKLINAIRDGLFVSDSMLKRCFKPYALNDGTLINYGYGWFIGELDQIPFVYHGGGVYGFVAHNMYFPQQEIYIAILRNCVDPYTSHPTHAIGDMIAGIMLEIETTPNPQIAIELPPVQLMKYTGIYKLKNGGKRKITFENSKLYYESPPRKSENPWDRTQILPSSAYDFFARGKKSTITFHFAPDLSIAGFTINQPFGRCVSAEKID